jgi:ubiquinone/menaquinone biosynthesis C-methylase UbiE
MKPKQGNPIDYADPKVRDEILKRQRMNMWSPEQVASLAKHFRLKPGMSMLDAGCGLGYCTTTWGRFCMPGGRLVGLDREEALLPQARRLARKAGLPDAKFVLGDICDMPFSDGEFDVTIEQIVLCHLAEPERAFNEMVRVTRPGGCVVVIDNAMTGGIPGFWRNYANPSIAEWLFEVEMELRSHAGQRKLAQGDFSVGFKIPVWMEKSGLVDIGIRRSELVIWAVPPYRTPDQQTAYEKACGNAKLRANMPRDAQQDFNRQMRAGGATEAQIRRIVRLEKKSIGMQRKALADRTAAWVGSGSRMMCVWGFKPTS